MGSMASDKSDLNTSLARDAERVLQNEALSGENNADCGAELLSLDSSLCSDYSSCPNDPSQTFFVGYSYMQILTTRSLHNESRGPKFFCHLCEYVFPTRLSMITHMKMHRTPFCPVCFAMFERVIYVHDHIAESHPEITQSAGKSIYIKHEVLSIEEDFDLQTGAPPNSPNVIDNTEQEKQDGTLEANNNSISFVLAEKLREHQKTVDLKLEIHDDDLSDQHVVPVSGKPQPWAGETIGKPRNVQAKDKKAISTSGSAGKVQKGRKQKSSPRIVGIAKGPTNEGKEKNVMRVTSRFGRSISLKVPQY